MARNRQRAKDRKQKKLHRENIPGALDHASGGVDEVEAAIVAGAGGVPVEPDDAVRSDDAAEPVAVEVEGAAVEPDHDDPDDEPYSEGQLDATAEAVEDKRLGRGAGDVAVTPSAHKPSGLRVFNFFRACWAELQRVDWPDRRQVGQATAVVLGFVVVAGAFLGLADVVAQRLVDLIL